MRCTCLKLAKTRIAPLCFWKGYSTCQIMASHEYDKPSLCLPFILDRINSHRIGQKQPFFLGVNGIQGSGKTTLVTALERTLANSPHHLSVIAFSIDDLYLTRSDQASLAVSNPRNSLLQHRGQPGTHDLSLAVSLFQSLRQRKSDILIPSYDKSAFNGLGDRRPTDSWRRVNHLNEPTVDVIIFEGWCVGFRSLHQQELEAKWQEARTKEHQGNYEGRLGKLNLQDVQTVNDKLREYEYLTRSLDAFIYLDAEDTKLAYKWRAEQEECLREEKGEGMTKQEVIEFVNGYYPAYELYTDQLRSGIFSPEVGLQLNLTIKEDRTVTAVRRI